MLNLNIGELHFLRHLVDKGRERFHYIERKDQDLLLQRIRKEIETKEKENSEARQREEIQRQEDKKRRIRSSIHYQY
tara:strand:- start:283 stop:513 length:231 start_codon:yes stop_codon:yes gene_type:complete